MKLPFWKEADFSLWARPKLETCDPDVENGNFWKRIDLFRGEDSIYEKLSSTPALVKGLICGMPCANIWMRSDYGRGSNGLGVNEIAVWAHFLFEVPDTETQPLGMAAYWDQWECFYQNKDPVLCSED